MGAFSKIIFLYNVRCLYVYGGWDVSFFIRLAGGKEVMGGRK